MGLIRKTLMVGTLGTVKGSSKKQRVARATLQAAQAAELAALDEAEAAQEIVRLTAAQAAREHEFRYDTDPAYRAWWDAKQAAAPSKGGQR